jgi:hypothetical protein
MLATKSFALAIRSLSWSMSDSVSGKTGGVDASEQSACQHSVPVGFAHLAREIIHVGIEAGVEQDCGIDLVFFGVSGRMVQ